jgi:hypothetical protein
MMEKAFDFKNQRLSKWWAHQESNFRQTISRPKPSVKNLDTPYPSKGAVI